MADTPPTITMFRPDTGEEVQVDAGQAGAVLNAGQATFARDQQVPVMTPTGVVSMSGTDAAAYLRSAGGRALGAASEAQLHQQQARDDLGGVGGTALAGVAGVARGLTLGTSDALVGTFGGAETLRDLQEVNPFTSTAGEVVGTLAPLIASGGAGEAGLAARGLQVAGAPVRGAVLLGEGAETLGQIGARALGAAEAGVGARAIGTAARTGTEFGLFEAGHEVSQQALAQQGYDAERVGAAFGHGALMGAVLGVGGSLLSSAGGAVVDYGAQQVGRAYTGVRDAATGLLDRGVEAGRGFVDRGLTTGREIVGRGQAAVDAGRAAVGGAVEAGREALPGLVERGAEAGRSLLERGKGAVEDGYRRLRASGALDRLGEEQALKSTGANLGQIERLRAMAPEVEERVRKIILDELPAEMGGSRILSRAQMAEAAVKVTEREGAKVGELIDQLSTSGVRTDIGEWASAQRRRVIDQLVDAVNPDVRRGARQLEDWIGGIQKKSGGDPRKLWETKRDLGRQIDWKAGTDNAYNELKKDLYFSLDREITRLGTESAEKMGADFASTWREANSRYQAARWVREATEKGAASEARNRMFGLSEQFGAVAGAALGGPLGVPMALAGVAGQNLARRYGSQALSQALLRPDALRPVIDAVTGRIRTTAERYIRQASPYAERALTEGRALAERGVGAARASVRSLADAANEGAETLADHAATAVESAVDVGHRARRAGQAALERGRQLGTSLADAADQAIETGGRVARIGAAEGSSLAAASDTPRTRADRYQQSTSEVQHYQAVRQAQMAGAAPPPALPPALLQVADAGAAFLASKAPTRPIVQTVQGPSQRQPTPHEQARYLRYADAIENPLGVIADARGGDLSRESVEAIRTVYPMLFDDLTRAVQEQVATRGEPLSRAERMSLARLLGLPSDAAHNDQTGRAVQQALNGGAPPPGVGATPAQPSVPMTRRPLRLPTGTTTSDRIEKGYPE